MSHIAQLPCIICHKQLEYALGRRTADTNQPSGGIACTTQGHYGSTVFDPMDASFLEINICDKCMVQAAENNLVYHYPKKGMPHFWEPASD